MDIIVSFFSCSILIILFAIYIGWLRGDADCEEDEEVSCKHVSCKHDNKLVAKRKLVKSESIPMKVEDFWFFNRDGREMVGLLLSDGEKLEHICIPSVTCKNNLKIGDNIDLIIAKYKKHTYLTCASDVTKKEKTVKVKKTLVAHDMGTDDFEYMVCLDNGERVATNKERFNKINVGEEVTIVDRTLLYLITLPGERGYSIMKHHDVSI